MLWKSSQAFDEIAKGLGVATATAQVFVIDILAQGRAEDSACAKVLRDLHIGNSEFSDVERFLTKPGCSLREIRDKTGLEYNQIRAVLAALKNGFGL